MKKTSRWPSSVTMTIVVRKFVSWTKGKYGVIKKITHTLQLSVWQQAGSLNFASIVLAVENITLKVCHDTYFTVFLS